MMTRLIFALALLICGPVRADQITVFAAASLRNVLDEIIAGYDTDDDVIVSYAGSSTLARQIQMGAPADIFISANLDWVRVLEKQGLISAESIKLLASNRLVLIKNATNTLPEFSSWTDWAETLGDAQVASAMVNAVPAGLYAKAALENLGVWDTVAPTLVQSDNVRAALALVALGAVDYGITYKTDALSEDQVSVHAEFPTTSHGPIAYPAAQLTHAPAVETFFAYLQSDPAQDIFQRFGFLSPDPGQ